MWTAGLNRNIVLNQLTDKVVAYELAIGDQGWMILLHIKV